MSLVITNPLSNIPKAPKSHNLGYAQIWADQLNAKIDHTCTKNIQNADIVYINHLGDLNKDHTVAAKAVLVALRPMGSKTPEIRSFETPNSTDQE